VFAWRAFPARGDASPGAYLTVPALEGAGIRVAFTTRHGGFSGDPFSSLNLSFFSGDDRDVVIANRARALAAIGADGPSWTSGRQVHGAQPARVTPDEKGAGSDGPDSTLAGIDALWTDEPGAVLAILIADCVPVLLADPVARRIATVHAGWRGMTSGVIEATVTAMGGDPSTLTAFIGPSIGPCCYEVGEDVAEPARAALGPGIERRNGSVRVDLWGGARIALRRAGVSSIHVSTLCTRCEPHRFFSHRAGHAARQGLLATIDAA
jgi:purine-nucleoside/S-methyl-5'-thioadenosine phosphorylase / adenosine deaminase